MADLTGPRTEDDILPVAGDATVPLGDVRGDMTPDYLVEVVVVMDW